jgi:hypothetical protein
VPRTPRPRGSDELDVAELQETVVRLLPEFVQRGPVRRTLKSRLLRGAVEGRAVFVKQLARRDTLWRWYFDRELELYRRFAVEAPPVSVPRLLAADEALGVLALEDGGSPLATRRRHGDALDGRSLDALSQICSAIGAWRRGLAIASGVAPSAADVRVMRRRLLEDPSAPLAWVSEGVQRCGELGFFDEAAVALLQQALRDHPAIAFAHGDLLPRNLLRAADRVLVVDWECAGPHLEGWDVALLWVNVPPLRPRLEATAAGRVVAAQRALWACAAFALGRELKFRARTWRADPDDPTARRLRAELSTVLARLSAL